MPKCGTATDSSASVADEAAQQQQQWNWKERGETETTAFTALQRKDGAAVSELAQPLPLVDSGIEEFEDLSTNHNAIFRGYLL